MGGGGGGGGSCTQEALGLFDACRAGGSCLGGPLCFLPSKPLPSQHCAQV